ncbi:hypothetical protein [Pikeienuella sp. HZG-20]|uniref:hypothetical protein n=1 Tax=Paludibacillus litoralis TaxID=3133267 RepID=UPI0030EE969D
MAPGPRSAPARIGALALLAAAAMLRPAAPAAGEITYWTGAALRTAPDPRAVPPARGAGPQSFGALIAEDVGLFIEPEAGAPAHAFNLVAGAVVRRFSGHIPLHRVLGAERILTLRAALTAAGPDLAATWRLVDSKGARLETFRISVRMRGAPAPGRPFAALTAEDAERIALQVAATLDGSAEIDAAKVLARLDRAPTPAPRPEAAADDPPLSFPPPPAPRERRTAPPAPLSRPG